MPCTTILVGKDASLDHAPLIARQEDYGNAFNPQSFRVILPQDQPRHYASKTTNFICDLPGNPLRYTSTPDVDSSAGVFAAGDQSGQRGNDGDRIIDHQLAYLRARPL